MSYRALAALLPGLLTACLCQAAEPARPRPVGTTPVPTREVQERFARFVGPVRDPEATLDLRRGQPRLLLLKEAPFRIQVGDGRLLGHTFLSPRELSLQAHGAGQTVLNLWFGDPHDPARQVFLSYRVRAW